MRLFVKIAFLGLLWVALSACGKDDEVDIKGQQDRFEAFLTGKKLEYDESLARDYIFKVRLPVYYVDANGNPLVDEEGNPREIEYGREVRTGDQIRIYYAGFLFNASASSSDGELVPTYGLGGLFTTNILSYAVSAGMEIRDPSLYEPFPMTLGGKDFLEGLNRAIPGSRVGEHIFVYLTSDLAYSTDEIGVVPKNTPLVFYIIIDAVE